MFKIAATLLPLSLSISCTGARKPEAEVTERGYIVSFDEDWYVIVEVPFEEAWGNILHAFRDQEWPVEAEDRVSLSITTEYVTIGINKHAGACYLSRARFLPFQRPGARSELTEMRSRLIVHLTPSGGAATKVRALAEVEGRFVLLDTHERGREGSSTEWQSCESTGRSSRNSLMRF